MEDFKKSNELKLGQESISVWNNRLPWTKVVPLPKRWHETSTQWKILERIGNEVLLEAIDQLSKRTYYEIQSVIIDQNDGREFVRHDMNLARPGGLDTSVIPGQEDPHWSLEKMKALFDKKCGNIEAGILRKQKEAKADSEARKVEQIWQDKVAEIKKQKFDLVYELKPLVREAGNVNSLMTNKRIKEICAAIDLCENILKYGK